MMPGAVRPRIEPTRPRIVEPPQPRRVVESEPPPLSEPTPSSVEIPIMFSDTPLSGEQFPDVEAVANAMEDQPTEMRERFPSSSDTDTTERRADLGHLAMGKRPRAGNISRMPRATTTERGSRPAFERSSSSERGSRPTFERSSSSERGSRPAFEKSSDTEIDDNNATLIEQTPQNIRRRQAKAAVSPDDTIRMDGDATNDVRDARDRLSSTPAEPATPARAPRSLVRPRRRAAPEGRTVARPCEREKVRLSF